MNNTKKRMINTLCVCMLICVSLILTSCNNTYGDKHESDGTVSNTKEEYYVLLSSPPENHVYKENDPPPLFSWSVLQGLPQTFIIEIDYMNDGTYMSRTTTGNDTYLLSESDWAKIVDAVSTSNGLKKVQWRIRINYAVDVEKEPYYSGWNYFWIEVEK